MREKLYVGIGMCMNQQQSSSKESAFISHWFLEVESILVLVLQNQIL